MAGGGDLAAAPALTVPGSAVQLPPDLRLASSRRTRFAPTRGEGPGVRACKETSALPSSVCSRWSAGNPAGEHIPGRSFGHFLRAAVPVSGINERSARRISDELLAKLHRRPPGIRAHRPLVQRRSCTSTATWLTLPGSIPALLSRTRMRPGKQGSPRRRGRELRKLRGKESPGRPRRPKSSATPEGLGPGPSRLGAGHAHADRDHLRGPSPRPVRTRSGDPRASGGQGSTCVTTNDGLYLMEEKGKLRLLSRFG